MTKDEALQVALGALADIANSNDMTLAMARKKAARIYKEVTAAMEAIELKQEK